MPAKRTWTDRQFIKAVANNISVSGVLCDLGLRPGGDQHVRIRFHADRLNLDTSHWKGQGYREGKTGCRNNHNMPSLKRVMVKNSTYSRGALKSRLIQSGALKNECSICGQGLEWQGMNLVMVLDHINGVNNDHRRCNLRLVCPNCDSQLPTYKGRNK